MKKLAVIILISLTTVGCALGFYLYSFFYAPENPEDTSSALQTDILNRSSRIYITEKDFHGYLNGTYTDSIEKIIESLEEAIPVIFRISGGKFNSDENGTYVIASAFNTEGNIYVYSYNPYIEKYQKNVYSPEYIFEDADVAYIYEAEVVK